MSVTPSAVTVIVPTFNESGNVNELVRRVGDALAGTGSEILFVDDSRDDTADVARAAALTSAIPVRVIHRERPEGGLGGAVLLGLREAENDLCVVMDGDLQHPPETIPELVARRDEGGFDVVVASRYTGDGDASGLSDRARVFVSRLSTLVTKSMFPIRLREVSDPMTGFFLVDRRSIQLDSLRPRGFKILLEILARQNLHVAEVPFSFAERGAGESKASLSQGVKFLLQLGNLRFGRMSVFAIVGIVGAIANLIIMAGLQAVGVEYVWAAIVASVVTIIGNFLLIEQFVFKDLRATATTVWTRFAKSFSFNAVEAVVRIAVLYLVVSTWHVPSVLVAAVTLVLAFIVRYVFHAMVVYAPRKETEAALEDSTGV
ncbi:glycosyltransferase [Microbacterium gorillae]|uniref:glycosyltransferase n=1 Tax=Microbacterium gorillae TaxID=1231063 RepID=UPI00058B9FB7|nr:glycosyltransferase [Microbacterium gorillae]